MKITSGVDILEIDRIKKIIEKEGETFLLKIYTENEIKYCEKRNVVKYKSYAARFAAKEAVLKAFGTGMSSGIELKDIEILNEENGRPYVVLKKGALEFFEKMNGKDICISLSHSEKYTVANVIISTK